MMATERSYAITLRPRHLLPAWSGAAIGSDCCGHWLRIFPIFLSSRRPSYLSRPIAMATAASHLVRPPILATLTACARCLQQCCRSDSMRRSVTEWPRLDPNTVETRAASIPSQKFVMRGNGLPRAGHTALALVGQRAGETGLHAGLPRGGRSRDATTPGPGRESKTGPVDVHQRTALRDKHSGAELDGILE